MDIDRISDGYEPRFDIDIERGRQGEMFVLGILEALKEGGSRVEVKRDDRSQETGNIYVEYQCRRRDGWAASGIAVSEAQIWVFVLCLGDLAVCVSTERLKQLARVAYRRGRVAEETDGSHPTKGVLIRLTDLVRSGTKAFRGTNKATSCSREAP